MHRQTRVWTAVAVLLSILAISTRAEAPGGQVADCRLVIEGRGNTIAAASMHCKGGTASVAVDQVLWDRFSAKFQGVTRNNSCKQSGRKCLITVCNGRMVLRGNISSVQGASWDALLCVAGSSTVEAHGSLFSGNSITPLACMDRAGLLLHESTVSDNIIQGDGGGMLVEGDANVIITGGSSVHGNNNTQGRGGGLVAKGNATLTISGNSSVHSNVARSSGGGVFAKDLARVTITGGSRVHGNNATERSGGGVAAVDNVIVTIDGNSSVHGNSAASSGGGFMASVNASVSIDGNSSVHSNSAYYSGGGLAAIDNVTLTITGGSTVLNNSVINGTGGGLDIQQGIMLGVYVRVSITNNSHIIQNTCTGGGGGGISVGRDGRNYANGKPIKESLFDRIDMDWDHLFQSDAHVLVSNSTIGNNTSNSSAGGGGLWISGNATVVLKDSARVNGNGAVMGSGGGAIVLQKATLHVQSGVVFDGNKVDVGYVGSSIAAFDRCKLALPARGNFTKCSAGVYLGRRPCGQGEVPQHDICVCCPSHTYSFTNKESCSACPLNANCNGNHVDPLAGYWHSSSMSAQIHRCPLSSDACLENGQCSTGHTGNLCGACKLPEYGMVSPMKCAKCMSAVMQFGLYALLCFVCVGFIVFTVYTTWRDNMDNASDQQVHATDMIKVLVQFLQYVVIIGSVSVPWPRSLDLQRFFQAAAVVFGPALGHNLSLDCWLIHLPSTSSLPPLPVQRQSVYFLAPFVIFVMVVGLQCLLWDVRRWVAPLMCRCCATAAQQQRTSFSVMRNLPVTALVVAYYAYPTLVKASMSFFACMPIDKGSPVVDQYFDPGDVPQGGVWLNHALGYWVSDIQQACFAGYHKGWALGLGLPTMLLLCVGVPVVMGVGLKSGRAKADVYEFREQFGFLYQHYKPERMWWEAVWVAQTVILTLVSVFSIPMESFFSILGLLVVFLISAALQGVFRPYAMDGLHQIHISSTSCLVVTTLGALAMFAYEINPQISGCDGLQTCRSEVVKMVITVSVLFVDVLFVLFCAAKLFPFAVKGYFFAVGKSKRLVSWADKQVRTVPGAVMACLGTSRQLMCRAKTCGRRGIGSRLG